MTQTGEQLFVYQIGKNPSNLIRIGSGSLGNVCSFPHGEGSCKAGICTLKSCDRGYFQEAGVCTALDLSSDVLNCGDVDEKCSFDNGAGCVVQSRL